MFVRSALSSNCLYKGYLKILHSFAYPGKDAVVKKLDCSEHRIACHDGAVVVSLYARRDKIQHLGGDSGVVNVASHLATSEPREQRQSEGVAHCVNVYICNYFRCAGIRKFNLTFYKAVEAIY